MPIKVNEIGVFRMIAIQNLERDLKKGLFAKNKVTKTDDYVRIGNDEIISRRDTVRVPCNPKTVVNDYVAFYFSKRTPMLYNIHTGRVGNIPQSDIIYLCCRLTDLTTDDFEWCYTDGNAASAITKYFNRLEDLENVDWRSVKTTDFRDANADGDEDRVRKKHAEFLVKDHVPTSCISLIVVHNQQKKREAEEILKALGLAIPIKVNPNNNYYFQ